MEKFTIEDKVNTAEELERLMELNGFHYSRAEERYRLVFSDRGRKWETVCVCRERAVIIYGIYPFPVRDRQKALSEANKLNSLFLFGGMFVMEDSLVFRTCADIFDTYSAYESIARALEYNADVVFEFWSRMAACSQENAEVVPVRPEKPDVF